MVRPSANRATLVALRRYRVVTSKANGQRDRTILNDFITSVEPEAATESSNVWTRDVWTNGTCEKGLQAI